MSSGATTRSLFRARNSPRRSVLAHVELTLIAAWDEEERYRQAAASRRMQECAYRGGWTEASATLPTLVVDGLTPAVKQLALCFGGLEAVCVRGSPVGMDASGTGHG
jgi:hypothetical protein